MWQHTLLELLLSLSLKAVSLVFLMVLLLLLLMAAGSFSIEMDKGRIGCRLSVKCNSPHLKEQVANGKLAMPWMQVYSDSRKM